MAEVSPLFRRYVGIDYSGAASPLTPLAGLRVFMTDGLTPAVEVQPDQGSSRHWCRARLADWLVARLGEGIPTVVGLDHGFSFPLAYFEKYRLPRHWPAFLDDFQAHWPTDDSDTTVEQVRRGQRGNGAAREGDSRWRRLAEVRTRRAKSVFHFDVPGAVAKSTHAGLPWLRFVRRHTGANVHCWPFDGWEIAAGKSVLAEIYPSLWRDAFPREQRTADQQDAYCVAAWLGRTDRQGALGSYFLPRLSQEERHLARVEGWILGLE